MFSIKFGDRNIYKKKLRKHIPSLTLNGRPLNIQSYFITTDRYSYRLQYIHIVINTILFLVELTNTIKVSFLFKFLNNEYLYHHNRLNKGFNNHEYSY